MGQNSKEHNLKPSTFLKHTHNIDHTFRLYECACTNIKAGMTEASKGTSLGIHLEPINKELMLLVTI